MRHPADNRAAIMPASQREGEEGDAATLFAHSPLALRASARSANRDGKYCRAAADALWAPASRRQLRKNHAGGCRRHPAGPLNLSDGRRSEEHTSELQSLMRISYA